jgi:hypothetical protein
MGKPPHEALPPLPPPFPLFFLFVENCRADQQYAASKRLLGMAGVRLRQHLFTRPVTIHLTNRGALALEYGKRLEAAGTGGGSATANPVVIGGGGSGGGGDGLKEESGRQSVPRRDGDAACAPTRDVHAELATAAEDGGVSPDGAAFHTPGGAGRPALGHMAGSGGGGGGGLDLSSRLYLSKFESDEEASSSRSMESTSSGGECGAAEVAGTLIAGWGDPMSPVRGSGAKIPVPGRTLTLKEREPSSRASIP